MHAEHHPRPGNRDGDEHGRAREQRACPRRAPTTEQERGCRVERRGGGGVPRGKGRPERLRDRVDRRPQAVEHLLEPVRDQVLTEDHEQDERDDPAARGAEQLHGDEDQGEDDHDERVTEVREGLDHVCRPGGRVVRAPLGDARVELDQLGIRADEVREQAKPDASHEDDDECDRERESGRHRGIAPPAPERSQMLVATHLAPDPLGSLECRRARGGNVRRVAGGQKRSHDAGSTCDEEDHEQSHGFEVYPIWQQSTFR